ncbi:MAG: response regulator [Deltaproteobacteria bacterium]|nr:response regulator [Deltaproteobacteria bacterium]
MPSERNEKILMVDDDALVSDVVGAILRNQGFRFEWAGDGAEGLRKARDLQPDLIFLDISMPGLDGFQTCRKLKEDPVTLRIPVVMLTAHADRESRIKALEAGASDFLAKPVDGTEMVVRVGNILKAKRYQDSIEEHSRVLEIQVEERTRQLKESLLDTVQRLTLASEYRDVDSYVHVKRISYYSEIILRKLDITGDAAHIMYYASPMHDIGKVGIPDAILLKPGVLTEDEFEIMKTHTTIGARILRGSSSPYLKSAERFALYHHERWDGKGYPQGLKGEAIPIEGRIMNLIDQYDALRSKRPYKPPYEHERSVSILLEGGHRTSPDHFDPRILQIFRECSEEFRAVYETHQSW